MYVYIRSEPGVWTVGFYISEKKWVAESDHESPEAAAQRVAWLNGGCPDYREVRVADLEQPDWEDDHDI